MRRMILIGLLVLVAGGAVGASADSPPTMSPDVTCGPAAVQQAQQAGLTVPTNGGTDAMVCWFPAHER